MLLRSRSYLLRRNLLTRVVTPMLVQKAAVEDSALEMLPDYVELQGSSVLWCGLCDVKNNLKVMKQHLRRSDEDFEVVLTR